MNVGPIYSHEDLRRQLGPKSHWAIRCGALVRKRRTDLGLSLEQVAVLCDVSVNTVHKVETGALVPRDYLRAAVSFALALEVTDLWPPMRRAELAEAVAS